MKRIAIAVVAAAALGGSPAALAAGRLTGKYTTKDKGTPATLNLMKGGRFTVALNGKTIAHSKYSVTGNTITFYPKPHNPKCHTPGTYKFNLTGKQLRFTRIHDVCGNRADGFTNTFTKVG